MEPAGREALSAELSSGAPLSFSVVMPVLNEAERVDVALLRLCAEPGWHALIVVDGGSEDATREIVRRHAERDGRVRLISAARGRGVQLAAGARVSEAQALCFLHCDVRLPVGALGVMRACLAEHHAGAFVTETRSDGAWPAPWLRVADVRSRLTRVPYGDQALFVKREAYVGVGGFPEVALFEDVVLSRALARLGPIARVRPAVRVSGRRFERSPLRTMLAWNLLPSLYRLGLSEGWLVRLYG